MLSQKMPYISIVLLTSIMTNCGKKSSKKNDAPIGSTLITVHMSFDKFVTGCSEQVMSELNFEHVQKNPQFAQVQLGKGLCPENSSAGKPILGGCKHPDSVINWYYESDFVQDVEDVKRSCESTTTKDDSGQNIKLIFVERK